MLASIVSWSATSIAVSIPTSAIVGKTGYFTVHLADGSVGERTAGFAVVASSASAPTAYPVGTRVFAIPGTRGI